MVLAAGLEPETPLNPWFSGVLNIGIGKASEGKHQEEGVAVLT